MQILRVTAVPLLVGWIVAAVIAGAWTLAAGGPFPDRLGVVAVALGAVVLLSAGGTWMRRGTLAMRGQIATWPDLSPGDDTTGRPGAARLTGTGLGLFVGLPLLLLGAALATA